MMRSDDDDDAADGDGQVVSTAIGPVPSAPNEAFCAGAMQQLGIKGFGNCCLLYGIAEVFRCSSATNSRDVHRESYYAAFQLKYQHNYY